MLDFFKDRKTQLPSVINNPFGKNKIDGISIRYIKSFTSGFTWVASVDFKNGDTKGSQSFREENFEDIIAKIKYCIETLEEV
jgi:elongation factor P hydroxylase